MDHTYSTSHIYYRPTFAIVLPFSSLTNDTAGRAGQMRRCCWNRSPSLSL